MRRFPAPNVVIDTAAARPKLEFRLPRVFGARASALEKAAVGTTALAIAALPLLVPGGPANSAPVDILIAVATTTCLFWAWREHLLWHFPYAIPMAVFVAGGALGALAGPVPARRRPRARAGPHPARLVLDDHECRNRPRAAPNRPGGLGVQRDGVGGRPGRRARDRLTDARRPDNPRGRPHDAHPPRSQLCRRATSSCR